MTCHTFSFPRSVLMSYAVFDGMLQCSYTVHNYRASEQSNMILLSVVPLTENKVRTGLMCHFDVLVTILLLFIDMV